MSAHRQRYGSTAAVLGALLVAGCGSDAGFEPRVGTPVVLRDGLVYVDASAGAAIIVDPTGTAGATGTEQLVRVEVGSQPLGNAVSLTDPASTDARYVGIINSQQEELVLLRDKSGALTRVPVGLPFDALDASASGRWAVAYQPDNEPPQNSMFAFPNALAIIDLAAREPAATVLRLPSAGTRPHKVVFAEGLQFAGTTAASPVTVSLALVFVEGGIVPVDLGSGQVGDLVPLTIDDALVLPAEVIFTNNEADRLQGGIDDIERAYVRGTNGQLYVLAISLAAPGRAAVVVTLDNVVTPDSVVSDIDLFFTPEGRELLLAAAGSMLVLVDGYTGVATRFTPAVTIDTLARFEDAASGRALALGFNRTNKHDKLLRIDPLGLDQRRASGMETLDFATTIAGLELGASAARAVVTYGDATTLGILDLSADGDVLDVRMASAPQARRLATDGERLWVVSESPTDGAPHLAEITLSATPSMRDVRLDARGTFIGEVGGFVFVDHGDSRGSVTFFPRESLTRDDAIAFRAVGFTDYLSSPEVTE